MLVYVKVVYILHVKIRIYKVLLTKCRKRGYADASVKIILTRHRKKGEISEA